MSKSTITIVAATTRFHYDKSENWDKINNITENNNIIEFINGPAQLHWLRRLNPKVKTIAKHNADINWVFHYNYNLQTMKQKLAHMLKNMGLG